jgi:cytochrome oxidase Cu insertion factor (SCO1/SenC/PrrC family)
MNHGANRRDFLRAGVCVGGLGLGAVRAIAHTPSPRSAAELMDALMWNREPIGGPFALTDQQGRRRTDRDFRGKWLMVYFGFTSCPDVCPTDLQQIGLLLQALGPEAARLQAVFITLDPERDDPRRLASYLKAFDGRIAGLTGDERAVRQAAAAYRMYFRKVPVPPGGYTIDHAAVTYLMDPQGSYLGFFPPGTSAARMLQIVQPQLRAGAGAVPR